MYFNILPDIQYSNKPIQFPFSEVDYVNAKNFFKRYVLDEKKFSYSVFFNKYTIKDSDRLDLIAERYYGDGLYDWVIILTNNMINGIYDWPLDTESFSAKMDAMMVDPYSTIHHYETKELKAGYQLDGIDVIALKGGITVSEEFYNGEFKYWNGVTHLSIAGSEVSFPVTIFEHEQNENEKKREIYILKNRYLESFVNAFKKESLYTQSSDFISNKLKGTSI